MELKELLKKSKEELAKRKSARLNAVRGGTSNVKVNGGMPEGLKKSLRDFGVKSLDRLIHVNTADKKFAYLGESKLDQVKSLKEGVDIAVMCAKLFGKPVEETKYYKDELSFQLKAFGISSGDDGYEWIPTEISSSYLEEYNLERKVSGLFADIKMPTNPYKFPVVTKGAIARTLAPATATGKQVFGTSNITFDATKLANRYELPEELSEDTAPDIIKVIRDHLIEGQEKAIEIAILEGDTDGTHMHSNTQLPDATGAISADSPEKSFDGLRKRVKGTAGAVDALAAAIDETLLAKARKAMGKFGVDPKQLAMISGVKVYNDLQQLDDVRTIEQYGAQATILTGELAKYEAIPVIVSEYLREDTNASAVNGAVGAENIKSTIILVNRKRFFNGLRRPIQVRVENNKTEFDVLDMVSFSRKAFQGVLKADGSNYAEESSVAMIYNIAV